jgi:hypothetical protein
MALSIGSLEIRIMPSKGKSISRIRKMAPATESVDATKATVAVGLGGASRMCASADYHLQSDDYPRTFAGSSRL